MIREIISPKKLTCMYRIRIYIYIYIYIYIAGKEWNLTIRQELVDEVVVEFDTLWVHSPA
jgi:hypothetical protein